MYDFCNVYLGLINIQLIEISCKDKKASSRYYGFNVKRQLRFCWAVQNCSTGLCKISFSSKHLFSFLPYGHWHANRHGREISPRLGKDMNMDMCFF